jgi:hypothetical protein
MEAYELRNVRNQIKKLQIDTNLENLKVQKEPQTKPQPKFKLPDNPTEKVILLVKYQTGLRKVSTC